MGLVFFDTDMSLDFNAASRHSARMQMNRAIIIRIIIPALT
ncbi:MAG: hypothetical protein R3E13_09450 [Alphaproteobacteria bacterium]